MTRIQFRKIIEILEDPKRKWAEYLSSIVTKVNKGVDCVFCYNYNDIDGGYDIFINNRIIKYIDEIEEERIAARIKKIKNTITEEKRQKQTKEENDFLDGIFGE